MNKQRRKQIADVISRVETVQAELESLLDDIQGIWMKKQNTVIISRKICKVGIAIK